MFLLDLDETLIKFSPDDLPLFLERYRVNDGYVYIRPYARELIEYIMKEHDLGIWTAAESIWADMFLEHLGIPKDKFKLVWSRSDTDESGLKTDRIFLTKSPGVSLDKTVLLDDRNHPFQNAVKIPPWDASNPEDEVLKNILEFIKEYPDLSGYEYKKNIKKLLS